MLDFRLRSSHCMDMVTDLAPVRLPESLVDVRSLLAGADAFWEHWGFEPWAQGALTGVCRLQRFVKDGFLGRIAEYRAWDCVVWNVADAKERENLWRAAVPMPEVMTQRFVFLVDEPWPARRIRSFLFGFRGYVEFFGYAPLGTVPGPTEAKDLTDLVDMALRFAVTGKAASETPL